MQCFLVIQVSITSASTRLSILVVDQVNAKKKMEIKGGLNISKFVDVGSALTLGFTLGITKEWHVDQRSSITAGLMYSQKRSTLKNKTIGYYGIDDVFLWNIYCRANYLVIPLFYRYYLSNQDQHS